ncbi:Outer membrane protein OmpA [Pseudoduganella namucuonensis]|uniref:Outer membrane protein OmpA n=2 Tax=Pseudoduganella namucuonensis TaxID=1035707 RepID=A0A1I7M2B1_9BURK|nr:Outer membrane protein OmpA [Pseudoduganella namucuonensis]
MGALVWIVCLIAAISQHNSGPAERITLLPSQDGRPSAVVVTSAKGEAVLDRPYQSAAVDRSQAISAGAENAAEVRARYAATLAALPQGAAVFTVYFETGTENLIPESAARLAQIKADMSRRPAPEVIVIGHTDRVDTAAFNDALSLKRAEHVKLLLIEAGVPADSISVSGRGEREPVVATSDGKAEQRNRRVEIRVR